jgi:hypothetical protein
VLAVGQQDDAEDLAAPDGGKSDGFLATQKLGDTYPISYYTEADLPVLAKLARSYTTLDNYFCSIAGATWPNRTSPQFSWRCGLDGERGLSGIVLDPNFDANGYVYLYYTTADKPIRNQLVRVTARYQPACLLEWNRRRGLERARVAHEIRGALGAVVSALVLTHRLVEGEGK